MMNRSLPENYTLRHPTSSDLEGVSDLIIACDLADRGKSEYSTEDLGQEWRKPGFELGEDAWVALAEDGVIVGYEEVYNRKDHYRLDGDGYVHPEHRGQGIGTTLLRVMEERAREHLLHAPTERRVTLRNGVNAADQAGRTLHEQEGYTPVRYFWRMEINMHTVPPGPAWPSGIQVRNLIPGMEERQVYEAFEEAFQGHWGDSPWDFETWRQRRVENEGFDPSLWFIAWDDGRIAGGVIGRLRQDIGWVVQLAVRPAWRQKGLGLALLQQVLGEFYRRGVTEVGLGVDAHNRTGATRLYERAGMYVESEYIVYEKELRPGLES
ncbi:MAG TPA: GNAT family N-acetyltransferase [Anaerolineales bacterium]|nr:GNAT family N-acetyltransferase [Anaerolineales bacterium]